MHMLLPVRDKILDIQKDVAEANYDVTSLQEWKGHHNVAQTQYDVTCHIIIQCQNYIRIIQTC